MMNKLLELRKFLNTHVGFISWDYKGHETVYPTDLFDVQKDWNQTLVTKFNQVSASIFQDTLSGGANVILIPSTALDVLITLEYLKKDVINYDGYYRLGILAGRFSVYVIPELTESLRFDEHKLYVCNLDDITDILNLDSYVKISVVTIKNYKS